jgi:hypothetical protein
MLSWKNQCGKFKVYAMGLCVFICQNANQWTQHKEMVWFVSDKGNVVQGEWEIGNVHIYNHKIYMRHFPLVYIHIHNHNQLIVLFIWQVVSTLNSGHHQAMKCFKYLCCSLMWSEFRVETECHINKNYLQWGGCDCGYLKILFLNIH